MTVVELYPGAIEIDCGIATGLSIMLALARGREAIIEGDRVISGVRLYLEMTHIGPRLRLDDVQGEPRRARRVLENARGRLHPHPLARAVELQLLAGNVLARLADERSPWILGARITPVDVDRDLRRLLERHVVRLS